MSGRPFIVTAPCTTANLGAGFDALGMALGGPKLTIRCTPGGVGLRIVELTGEGAAILSRGADNRVLVAARAAARQLGISPDSLSGELAIDTTIPLARGLGSSAAAAIAGALLAEALHGGAERATISMQAHRESTGPDAEPQGEAVAQTRDELRATEDARAGAALEARALAAALELEGHPDNIIATLRGGAQVAVLDSDGKVHACEVRPARPLGAALFIPDQQLATSDARAVLPLEVPLRDAVFNLGRSALFVAALAAGPFELFGEAMDDRLHQPQRTQLLPWLPRLLRAARDAGAYGAALSGAGTTVCALCDPAHAQAVAGAMASAAQALALAGRAQSVSACAPGALIS